MYHLAICDDEQEALEETEQLLLGYRVQRPQNEFVIERYETPESMLYQMRENGDHPDLIFLDIYLNGRTGIEIAQELRDMGSSCRVVFLTNSREHALEAFGVNAMQYLLKPVSFSVFMAVLDRFFMEKEKEKNQYLLLRTDGRIRRVSFRDIVCCEAQGNQQKLMLADGEELMLRMTLTELYNKMSGRPEFVRVGAAYVINLIHTESLNAKNVEMDTGEKIHLPRGAYATLREHYFDFYCGEE